MCEEEQRGRRGHCAGVFSVTRLLVADRRVNITTAASVRHVGGRREAGLRGGGWGGERPFSRLHSHHSPNLLLAWPAVTFGMFYGPGPTIAVKYKMALCDSFAAIRGRSRFLTG